MFNGFPAALYLVAGMGIIFGNTKKLNMRIV